MASSVRGPMSIADVDVVDVDDDDDDDDDVAPPDAVDNDVAAAFDNVDDCLFSFRE